MDKSKEFDWLIMPSTIEEANASIEGMEIKKGVGHTFCSENGVIAIAVILGELMEKLDTMPEKLGKDPEKGLLNVIGHESIHAAFEDLDLLEEHEEFEGQEIRDRVRNLMGLEEAYIIGF